MNKQTLLQLFQTAFCSNICNCRVHDGISQNATWTVDSKLRQPYQQIVDNKIRNNKIATTNNRKLATICQKTCNNLSEDLQQSVRRLVTNLWRQISFVTIIQSTRKPKLLWSLCTKIRKFMYSLLFNCNYGVVPIVIVKTYSSVIIYLCKTHQTS